MIFRPLIEKWIGSLMRAGLTALGGYLMAQGLIAEDQSAQLIAIAPILAGLAWSAYEKISAQAKVKVATDMPAGTTTREVAKEVRALTFAGKLDKALTAPEPEPPNHVA